MLLNLEQDRRFDPKIFKPIELSLIAGEKMDDDITVVDENPSALWLTFNAVRPYPAFTHPTHNLAMQRAKLSYVVGSRYDKYVGE